MTRRAECRVKAMLGTSSKGDLSRSNREASGIQMRQGACISENLCYTKPIDWQVSAFWEPRMQAGGEARDGQKQRVWNNRLQKRTSTQRRKEDVRRQTPGLFSSLLFSSLLFSSLIIFSLGLSACTGNGGSVDSGGEVYNPNGTPVSSSGSGVSSDPGSSGSSGSSASSGNFTAQDLMNAANSGDAGRIIQLVSQTGTASSETQTVSMSAADLGLPAGGTVILTVTGGGVNFSEARAADADGFVRFEVPKVETDKVVTIELSVLDSNGTVLWYGSDTQQVKDGGNLSISLTRQYWTLTSGSIAISASSYSLLYDPATWESDATTLSVTGLDAAPAGSTFSYEWKDEGGNVVGTGATLTQSVYQLYGSPAGAGSIPPGDITKSITVTVSYTDASGAAVTADASAEIALGGPVVLPTFSLHAAPPANPAGYDATASDPSAATPRFALTSRSAGIVITADAGAAEFPAGTQFTLTVNGTAFPAQASPSWTVSLADLGYNTDATAPTLASPASLSISCEASNTRAQVPETGSGSASVCLLYTIPSFTISLTPPAYVAAKSDTTNKKYALTDLDGDFSFTPVPAAGTSFPAGTTFTWTVIAGSASPSTLTPDTGVGESCTKSLSDFGLTDASIGRTAAAATGISVSCTARNDHAESDRSADSPAAMSAFLLYTLPAFTISVSLDAAGYDAGNSALTDTDNLLYALINMGKEFTLTATPGAGSFPADTEFEWTVRGTTLTGPTQKGSTITISPTAMGLTDTQGLANSVSAARNSPTGISIACTAKNVSAAADVNGTEKNVKVYRLAIPAYRITVTPPSAPNALETEGSGADTVYLVSILELDAAGKKFTLKAEPVNSGDSFPDGTEFSWKFGAASWTTADDDDDEMQVTVKTMCGGITSVPAAAAEYTIQCKASLTGAATPTIYPATTTVKVKGNPVLTVAADDFGTVLAGLGNNTTADAGLYKFNITGLNSGNLADIKTALKDSANSSKYVDLSETTIPDTFTDLTDAFNGCTTLVKPPVLPDTVTNLTGCFNGCSKLREAPVLPDGVLNISGCFGGCSSLATAPVIPESVTNMRYCFDNCGGLTGNVVIKSPYLTTDNSVENAFENINGNQLRLYVSDTPTAYNFKNNAFTPFDAPLIGDFHFGPPWPTPGE